MARANLRSHSFAERAFDFGLQNGRPEPWDDPPTWSLFLSNEFIFPLEGSFSFQPALNYSVHGLPYTVWNDSRLWTEETFNPPAPPGTEWQFNPPTTQQYLDSQANLFDPFDVSLLERQETAERYTMGFLSIQIGGQQGK
jgi:hypothetical protein